MESEGLKRAAELYRKIEELRKHLDYIEAVRKNPGMLIRIYCDGVYTGNLVQSCVPKSFLEEYVKNVVKRIESMQEEFKKI
jgi:hypothetical protein